MKERLEKFCSLCTVEYVEYLDLQNFIIAYIIC